MKIFGYINYGFYKFYQIILKEGNHSKYLSILALSFCQLSYVKLFLDYYTISFYCFSVSTNSLFIILIVINLINFLIHNALNFEKKNNLNSIELKKVYMMTFIFFILSLITFFLSSSFRDYLLKFCI